MNWDDEGYLLYKRNFDENSIIIEAFTQKHGRSSGIVYGGSSRKQKRMFQIGNKILLNWKSKGENKIGYFTTELIKPISPPYFDDKRKSISILAASSILKILLPERQVNKKIYNSFVNFLDCLKKDSWIYSYISWELSLIKELGYGFILKNKNQNNQIQINNKFFVLPKILLNNSNKKNFNKHDIKEALIFNKNLLNEKLIIPNRLRFPLSRKILEKYYN